MDLTQYLFEPTWRSDGTADISVRCQPCGQTLRNDKALTLSAAISTAQQHHHQAHGAVVQLATPKPKPESSQDVTLYAPGPPFIINVVNPTTETAGVGISRAALRSMGLR